MSPLLFDSHCHLNHDAFGADLPEVIGRARDAGVGRLLVPGFDLESSIKGIALARNDDSISAAAAVHPYSAAELDSDVKSRLVEIWASGAAVAVGEIGLDFAGRGYPEPEVQSEAFAWQLDQAERLGLPVIIHQRRSAAAILEHLAGRRIAGVMHCWSLGPEELDRFLELGLYVSFAGLLTFTSAEPVRAAATLVPDGRLLVETDAPYLVPRGARSGRRNEPANLPLTIDLLARLRQSAGDEIAALCAENARALFDLPDAA
ncbi:MAG: TatD family deoxyribonuclease [Chloroflexi bacterium]|nr:TatD family deoxyribonuclease [Chloroflexota bacterium]